MRAEESRRAQRRAGKSRGVQGRAEERGRRGNESEKGRDAMREEKRECRIPSVLMLLKRRTMETSCAGMEAASHCNVGSTYEVKKCPTGVVCLHFSEPRQARFTLPTAC